MSECCGPHCGVVVLRKGAAVRLGVSHLILIGVELSPETAAALGAELILLAAAAQAEADRLLDAALRSARVFRE